MYSDCEVVIVRSERMVDCQRKFEYDTSFVLDS